MSPNPNDLVGQTLNGYRLERILGVGGMSAVFLGVKSDSSRAAIKVLFLPWQASSEEVAEFRARFRREAQALLGLNNAHVPQIMGFGEERGYYFLILQYIDGGTLADRLTHGSMPFAETSTLLQQIAGALDYAHAQGIVHRDIKPTNVLLDSNNNAYLADFSIVQMLGGLRTRLTATGYAVGTPEYMSPEQVSGDGVTIASDVYSLGLLAYAMVTGHPPFEGASAVQLGIKHLQEMPSPPHLYRSDLPRGAEEAILRALAKSPTRRFSTAGEFAQAFWGGLQGNWHDSQAAQTITTVDISPTALVTPAKFSPVTSAQSSGSKVNLILIGVTVLSIAALLGVLFLHNGNNSATNTGGETTANSSDSTSLSQVSPTATLVATPTTTTAPVPTTVSTPIPGTVLYRTTDFTAWGASGSWKTVNGNLVNDGIADGYILAPFSPSGANYVLDMDVQMPNGEQNIGFVARVGTFEGGIQGYRADATCESTGYPSIANMSTGNWGSGSGYQMPGGSSWHHIRLVVKDTTFTLYADGQIVVTFSDAQDLNPGQVGIYADGFGGQGIAIIKDFSVTAA